MESGRQPRLQGEPSSALGSFYKGTFICRGEAPEALCPQLLRTEVPARLNSEILLLRGDILCAFPRDVCDLCDVGDPPGNRAGGMPGASTCSCGHSPNVFVKIPSPLLKASPANKDLCGSIPLSGCTLNLHAHLLLRHSKEKY